MSFEGCDGCVFYDRCGGLRGLLEGAAYRLDYLDEWHNHQSCRDMIMSRRLEKIRELNAALSQAEMTINRLLDKLADSEPVVHAHWICDCEPYHICSNCRHKFSLFDRVPRCPNCGAHMDEEVADGTR